MPASPDAERCQEGRQHNEEQADAVEADVIVDAERIDPRHVGLELDQVAQRDRCRPAAGGSFKSGASHANVEAEPERQAGEEGNDADREGGDFNLPFVSERGDSQRTGERQEDDGGKQLGIKN